MSVEHLQRYINRSTFHFNEGNVKNRTKDMSVSNISWDYFRQVRARYSISSVARELGLHQNTIQRWIDNHTIPKHYIPDFRRLLGKNGHRLNCRNAVKAKDQYYTKIETAQRCYEMFKQAAYNLDICLDNYCFIEPAAGCGWFYNLLPPRRRIGIDIEPQTKNLIHTDFLKWTPDNKNKKYVVIGNPPFGLRGHLALQFINHALPFADMVGFILPQLFASDGKGVPAKRVRSYKLAFSKKLAPDSFEYPDSRPITIHTIFQVWSKINTHKIKPIRRKSCSSFVKIYSLSNGGTPASTRNKKMIGKCDVYLPSTCFSGMKAYDRFIALPNKRGYGLVIHKNKIAIKRLLFSHDWQKSAFPSTNSALNLRTSIIEDVIIKAGYYD